MRLGKTVRGKLRVTAIACSALASDKSYPLEIRQTLEEAGDALNTVANAIPDTDPPFRLPAMMTLDFHLEKIIWQDEPKGMRLNAQQVYRRMSRASPSQMIRAAKSLHDFMIHIYGKDSVNAGNHPGDNPA